MSSQSPERPLLRDVLRFQVKLLLDALRDIVLSPLSLAAAAVDGVTGRRDRDGLFYRLLRLGRRSEEWIDLWGAARDPGEPRPENVDLLMGHVEDLLRDPRAGGRKARALRRWLDRERTRRRAGTAALPPPPP
jgi:hypothetical protein